MKINIIRVFLFSMVSLASLPLFSQGLVSVLDKSTNPGEVLMEFDNRDKEIKGTAFINDNWCTGDIILTNGYQIKNQLMRYDMNTHMLEVRIPDQVKIIPLYRLDEFRVSEPGGRKTYLNCDRYRYDDGTRLSGICLFQAGHRYGFIKKYNYTFKEAYYVPQFDMGSRSDRIIVESEPLLVNKDEIAYPIPHRKKSFFLLFGDSAGQVEAYVKNKKLNFKKEDDRIAIIRYANDLP